MLTACRRLFEQTTSQMTTSVETIVGVPALAMLMPSFSKAEICVDRTVTCVEPAIAMP